MVFSSPSAIAFTPDADIPSLSGRVIIVTGGNNGIGKETVKQLAKHDPARLYLAARSQAKFQQAVDQFKAEGIPTGKIVYLPLDLASLSSVAKAAELVLKDNARLDLLINNAGIMGAPASLTEDGYEVHFGTNHMGHAYFTKLLTPLLLKTAGSSSSSVVTDVRIINVTSQGEQIGARFMPFNSKAVKTDMAANHSYTRYGQSKFANVLFTRSLASKYPGIKSMAIHPGRVKTPLLDGLFSRGISFTSLFQSTFDFFMMVDVDEGAKNSLWAATSPLAQNGTYYEPIGKTGGESKQSHSVDLAEELWNWQEQEFRDFELRSQTMGSAGQSQQ
jgi:NAD(P)-dependent dehydrogenase (short-subunit alcohol dehydrogenase family)